MSRFEEEATTRPLCIDRGSFESLVRLQLEANKKIPCPYCQENLPEELAEQDIQELLGGLFKNKVREFCCPCCATAGNAVLPTAEHILAGFYHACGPGGAEQNFSVRFTLTEEDLTVIQPFFEPSAGALAPFQPDVSLPQLETTHEGGCGESLTILTLANGFTLVRRKCAEETDAERSSETDMVKCGVADHTAEVPIHLLVPAPYKERFQCFLPADLIPAAQLPYVEFPPELRFTVTHCGQSRVYDVALKKEEPPPRPEPPEEPPAAEPPPVALAPEEAGGLPSTGARPAEDVGAAADDESPTEVTRQPPRRRGLRPSYALIVALVSALVAGTLYGKAKGCSSSDPDQKPVAASRLTPPPLSPQPRPPSLPLAPAPAIPPPPPEPSPVPEPPVVAAPAPAPTPPPARRFVAPKNPRAASSTAPSRLPRPPSSSAAPSQPIQKGPERIYCSLDKSGYPTCMGGKPALVGTPEHIGDTVRARIEVICNDGSLCRDTAVQAPPGVLVEVK